MSSLLHETPNFGLLVQHSSRARPDLAAELGANCREQEEQRARELGARHGATRHQILRALGKATTTKIGVCWFKPLERRGGWRTAGRSSTLYRALRWAFALPSAPSLACVSERLHDQAQNAVLASTRQLRRQTHARARWMSSHGCPLCPMFRMLLVSSLSNNLLRGYRRLRSRDCSSRIDK